MVGLPLRLSNVARIRQTSALGAVTAPRPAITSPATRTRCRPRRGVYACGSHPDNAGAGILSRGARLGGRSPLAGRSGKRGAGEGSGMARCRLPRGLGRRSGKHNRLGIWRPRSDYRPRPVRHFDRRRGVAGFQRACQRDIRGLSLSRICHLLYRVVLAARRNRPHTGPSLKGDCRDRRHADFLRRRQSFSDANGRSRATSSRQAVFHGISAPACRSRVNSYAGVKVFLPNLPI